MSSYYEEILNEIDDMLEDGRPEEALLLIRRELAMPYIPADIEKKLKQLQDRCIYEVSEKKEPGQVSAETLIGRLHGNAEEQLSAASALFEHNLRGYIPEIQAYLAGDPLPEAAALLVDALAEQKIDDEFVWNRDGVEYTFFGDEVIPVAQSQGFVRADRILQKYYAQNPSLYGMARTLLIRKAYLYLPLSYEEDEAQILASKITEELSKILVR